MVDHLTRKISMWTSVKSSYTIHRDVDNICFSTKYLIPNSLSSNEQPVELHPNALLLVAAWIETKYEYCRTVLGEEHINKSIYQTTIVLKVIKACPSANASKWFCSNDIPTGLASNNPTSKIVFKAYSRRCLPNFWRLPLPKNILIYPNSSYESICQNMFWTRG